MRTYTYVPACILCSQKLMQRFCCWLAVSVFTVLACLAFGQFFLAPMVPHLHAVGAGQRLAFHICSQSIGIYKGPGG